MYCTKCGKKSEDGAKFCEHCGNPMDVKETVNVTQEAGKKAGELKYKFTQMDKKKKGFALGAAAAVLVVLLVVVFGGKTINLNNYVTVETKGYEGYGTAEWLFDYEKFEEDYDSKLKFKGAAEEYALLMTPCEAIWMGVPGNLSKDEKLSNGDKIVFSWDEGELEQMGEIFNYKFKGKEITVKVDNLEEIGTFDAFNGIYLEYDGCAPSATAMVRKSDLADEAVNSLNYSLDKNEGLSNGDVVTVTVEGAYGEEVAEYCAERFGKVPSVLTKEFTVEGLSSYVTAIEEIPEDMMSKMKTEVEDELRAYVARDWSENVSLENVTYIGSYLLNRKESSRYGANNTLYLVYNLAVHEDFSEDGIDNHFNYYYYGSFQNLMLLEDGTCSVDLSDISTSYNSFSRNLDPDSWWGKTLRYRGYEDLDSLFNQCVTAYVNDYTYTSTVEDIEIEEVVEETVDATVEETAEETEIDAEEN